MSGSLDEFCLDKEKIDGPSRNDSVISTAEHVRVRSAGEDNDASINEMSWAALSQIIFAFLLAFNIWGLVNSFGVYQTYYSESPSIESSNSQISWIGSLQAFLSLATMTATGPLFDRGYARWLITIGGVLDVLGMMMTSVATKYWQLMLSQGLCVGLGHGCLFVVAVGQIAVTFKTHKWMAFGLAQSGGSVGAIVYIEVFRSLQPTIGFGWATRTIAFIMLGSFLIAAALLRPRALPQPRKLFDADAFRNPPFLFFALASFTGFMGLYIPFFYLDEFALEHGLAASHQTNLASALIVILNTGGILGRILPGFVADRVGLMNTYTVCAAGATLLSFVWLACYSFGSLVVFAVIYGFFAGCTGALQPAVLASLAPTTNMVGTWVGMGSLFSSVGLLLGSPFAGLMLRNDGWTALRVWSAFLVLTCLLATVSTRLSRGGAKLVVRI